MSKSAQIKDILENYEQFVNYLTGLPDTKLERKLRVVRKQLDLAEEEGNSDAFGLLLLWEQLIIEARVLKHELPEIEYKNEMEEISAQVESFTSPLQEERKEIFKEHVTKGKIKVTREDSNESSQLNLFDS